MVKLESYIENLETIEALTRNIVALIKSQIDINQVKISGITCRVKSYDSLIKKINRKRYSDLSFVTDIIGIRIITYIENDIGKISNIIKSTFNIYESQSNDKLSLLKVNQFGYRSNHFICKIKETGEYFKDYLDFYDLKFEIQIRTILQHSWAEFEHDKNYKLNISLPKHYQRRLYQIAGTLEILDREFNNLSVDIDDYIERIKTCDIESYKLLQIDSINVVDYLNNKLKTFRNTVLKTKKKITISKAMIKELNLYGIKNVVDLDQLLNSEFIKLYDSNIDICTYNNILRDSMLFNDIEFYFKKAYLGSWNEIKKKNIRFLKIKYNKELLIKYFRENKINDY